VPKPDCTCGCPATYHCLDQLETNCTECNCREYVEVSKGKSMTAKKKHIYFGRVNLSGLYDNKPTTLYEDEEFYSSKDGNICVDLKNHKNSHGHIDFLSEDKNEVKSWIKGAEAVMTMLSRWSKPFPPKKAK